MAVTLGEALLLLHVQMFTVYPRNLHFHLAAHQSVEDKQRDVKLTHAQQSLVQVRVVWCGVVGRRHACEWPVPAHRLRTAPSPIPTFPRRLVPQS